MHTCTKNIHSRSIGVAAQKREPAGGGVSSGDDDQSEVSLDSLGSGVCAACVLCVWACVRVYFVGVIFLCVCVLRVLVVCCVLCCVFCVHRLCECFVRFV